MSERERGEREKRESREREKREREEREEREREREREGGGESSQITTVSTAILCPAVSVCDVMSKAGMCGKIIKHITSVIYIFIGQDRVNHPMATP